MLVIFTSFSNIFLQKKKNILFFLSEVIVYPLKILRKMNIHETLENAPDVFWTFYVSKIYVLYPGIHSPLAFNIPYRFWSWTSTTSEFFRLVFENISCKLIFDSIMIWLFRKNSKHFRLRGMICWTKSLCSKILSILKICRGGQSHSLK